MPPLGVPDGADEGRADALDLFAERARAANPSFELTAGNRDAVAEICRRLDGLPLAIELAAAQVRFLPPQGVLERLEHRLGLAARAGHAYPNRQQTLRAAIAWSVELLDDAERALFARASVFRGGWTLEALASVSGERDDVLDPVASLVEKSLVTHEAPEGAPRFSMLETIREYAAEELEARGDGRAAAKRHAAFYLGLVDEVGRQLVAARHGPALALLDRDEDNVRAALARLLEEGEYARVVDAGWKLLPYWTLRERLVEGRRWMRDVVERGELTAGPRGRALAAEAMLAFWGSDYAAAARLAGEALPLLRAAGDDGGVALAQIPLGVVQAIGGDREAGVALLEDARRRAERMRGEWGVAMSMLALAWAWNATGAEAPLEHFEETVERVRELGYEAETLAVGALGRRRAIRGEADEAKELLAEALRRTSALNARVGSALYVDLLADLAAAEGDDVVAVRLSSAAEAAAEAAGAAIPPLSGDRAERLRALRERAGDAAFEAERKKGRALSGEAAASEALTWAGAERA